MEKPILRHWNCQGFLGKEKPIMAIDVENSKVFVSIDNPKELTIRLVYVCPECGYAVEVDLK